MSYATDSRGVVAEQTGTIGSTPVRQRTDTVYATQVPERTGGVIIALGVVAAIILIDQALGDGIQIAGLLAAPAFVAATFVGPRRTMFVAAVQLGAVIAWGFVQAAGTDTTQLVMAGAVLLSGAGAVASSAIRVDLDQRLRAVTQIANLTQAAVLRPIPTVVGPVEVAVRYISATAEARVGGDFYEALPFAGGVRLVVGDVRGKGIGAVRLASALVGAFRAADHDVWPLERVLSSMDAAFARVDPGEEDFATVVLAEVSDDHHLVLLNCGHPPPLLIRQTSVEELNPHPPTPPVGLGPHPCPLELDLRADERLLLYTDGLIEARVGHQTFDVASTAAQMGTGALAHAVDRLRTDLVRFLSGHLEDDTTLMLIQPAASEPATDGRC